jgi:hypothetical protein
MQHKSEKQKTKNMTVKVYLSFVPTTTAGSTRAMLVLADNDLRITSARNLITHFYKLKEGCLMQLFRFKPSTNNSFSTNNLFSTFVSTFVSFCFGFLY